LLIWIDVLNKPCWSYFK